MSKEKKSGKMTNTGMLLFTVYGPFAYWETPKSVILKAPQCPNHTALLSTIGEIQGGKQASSEYPLEGMLCNSPAPVPNEYYLKFSYASGQIQAQVPCADKRYLIHKRSNISKPQKCLEWHFWLTLPKPNLVTPVSVGPSIVRNNNGQSQILGAGMRFVYMGFDPIGMELIDNQGTPIQDFSPEFPLFQEIGVADIELHFSGNTRTDPHHEDAWDCFSNVLRPLGLGGKYKPAGLLRNQLGGPHGDCYAPALWVR